ncbi:hypothetical protein I41_55230 [Lacipirellula limnantheis]|uniref:Uncharacterized protein n=1 Tax=Lacipirellula limnantheis TaxID=2528024 RepID=A0A517U6P4_9BACT|nr:hypothetical protein I41_55230 [Lacipirellula limnantheis]
MSTSNFETLERGSPAIAFPMDEKTGLPSLAGRSRSESKEPERSNHFPEGAAWFTFLLIAVNFLSAFSS